MSEIFELFKKLFSYLTKDRKYTILIEQINDQNLTVESNCNEIIFINKSTVPGSIAQIAGFPIDAGEFIGFSGNRNEECVRSFKCILSTPGDVWFIKKVYI